MRRTPTVAAAATILIGAIAAIGAGSASAETRGYVISWFATATNNPDFAINCPRAAKDPTSRFATTVKRRVDQAGDPRAGILSEASFTTLFSPSGRTSPTVRGKALRQNIISTLLESSARARTGCRSMPAASSAADSSSAHRVSVRR